MNLLIAGCGTVGAQLAFKMDALGHAVSIIDRNPERFALLGERFSGYTVVGNTIDLDLLRKAGIEGCDAVAAMTSSDNVNVMVSQIAKDVFGITNVLTRIYDPERARVFSQFGLRTICPTALVVDTAVSALTEGKASRHVTVGGHSFCLTVHEPALKWVGKSAMSVAAETGECPIGLLHADGSTEFLSQNPRATVKHNDKLLLMHMV